MKKTLDITKTVLTWIVVAFAVVMMIFTLISVSTLDRNDRSLFGLKFFIVQTDSMSATDFDAGDIVFSKEVKASTLKEGDIITFISQNSHNFGETVTHKIRSIVKETDGSLSFVTYGTTTNVDDEEPVKSEFIIGKYIGRIPNLGSFFVFLKTTPGYILCILVPFLLLILSQGISTIRLFRAYKKEQMDEMDAEKAKIAEERAESQRMMAELLELKEKLAQKEAEEKKDNSESIDNQ